MRWIENVPMIKSGLEHHVQIIHLFGYCIHWATIWCKCRFCWAVCSLKPEQTSSSRTLSVGSFVCESLHGANGRKRWGSEGRLQGLNNCSVCVLIMLWVTDLQENTTEVQKASLAHSKTRLRCIFYGDLIILGEGLTDLDDYQPPVPLSFLACSDGWITYCYCGGVRLVVRRCFRRWVWMMLWKWTGGSSKRLVVTPG